MYPPDLIDERLAASEAVPFEHRGPGEGGEVGRIFVVLQGDEAEEPPPSRIRLIERHPSLRFHGLRIHLVPQAEHRLQLSEHARGPSNSWTKAR